MLLKAGQIVQSVTPLLCQSLAGARFSKASYHTSIPKVDRKLLYPFNKDNTLRVLDSIQEQTNTLYEKDLKGLVVLDKISQTVTSDTHRVFDKCEKKFFAVKTLSMDSDNSWKQLNLIFRQQQENYPNLQKFSFLNYDHAGKEAKIITEIQKNVLLKDVLTPRTWQTEELKSLTFQLLRQADSLKQLGAFCNYIKPEHIFADQVTSTLKLYDFSGFEVERENSWGLPPLNLDAITFSLVKIIDPFAAVNHPEGAQIYFKRKYPEFYQELKNIKSKASSLSQWFNKRSLEGTFHDYHQKTQQSTFFHSAEYDQLNLNRFKQTIQSERLPNFNEVWGSVNQGFEKYEDAANAFQKSLDENVSHHGYIHENTCRSYLDLAETFQALERNSLAFDYFKKAINVSYNIPNMDGLLMARLYNGYGTLLKEQKQYGDALDCFKKADKALKDSGISHPSFAAKIEENLNSTPHSSEPIGDIYKDFANAWKEAFTSHHKSWHEMRHKNHAERTAARMKHFAENMEAFGKKMEKIGERYKNYNWEAEYSKYKWQSQDFFNKGHRDWWQKKCAEKNQNGSHHHHKGFMNCWGRWHRHYHQHHHNRGHWSHQNFGSWNKPPGCGFFYRTRRFIRFMFKLTFYTIFIALFIKLWKKAMKPPTDRPDGSFQMNGAPGLNTLQDEEKKEKKHCWGWWHRHHHRNDDQQNGSVAPAQEQRWGWWHHHHQGNEVQQNDSQGQKWGWWRRHHRNEDQQNDSASSSLEPERRKRCHKHSRQASQEASQPIVAAAPVITQEQGTQTEVKMPNNEEEQIESMRQRFHRRGFEMFRSRHGGEYDPKEFEETMKKYEEWKDQRHQMRHSEREQEKNIKSVERIEALQQKPVLAQPAPRVEENVRIAEPRQVIKRENEQKKERPNMNIPVSRENIAPLPMKKSEENIKISNIVSEANKDLPPQQTSNNWLLFGFYALVSTIGLTL